jgi:hypothetical protein
MPFAPNLRRILHEKMASFLVTRHPGHVVDPPPVPILGPGAVPLVGQASGSGARDGKVGVERARPALRVRARGVHHDRRRSPPRRGARMRTGHRRAGLQEIESSRHSGLAPNDSAPGWFCTAYDEHPGAGIDNHNAGRNRRSAVHVTRGAP